MFSKLALGGIWAYQKYLSPRKGYRCAYSVVHGGTGCSGYVKHAIRDHGIWTAWPKIMQRFRDCKTAHLVTKSKCAVHSQQLDDEERKELESYRRKDRWHNKLDWCCWGGCDAAACCGSASATPSAAPDAAGGACSSVDCGSGCDCTPGCDCSPSC